MVKKGALLGLMFVVCLSLQASDTRSSSRNSQASQSSPLPFEAKKQVVFFAIQNGFDDQLVQVFVDNAFRCSPSISEMHKFQEQINKTVKTQSPRVKELQRLAVDGSRTGYERAESQYELEKILACHSFYDIASID